MSTTNKKTNKSNVANVANESAASKDQIKFSGEVGDAVNKALAAYAAERMRRNPKLGAMNARSINGSSSGFNIGAVVSKGNGWSVVQADVLVNNVVTETYPALTNGIDTISLKCLCNSVVTGFSANPNDTFYAADKGVKGKSFADTPDVRIAHPTSDTQNLVTCAEYMKGKPNYTPIRLYCEIVAGNISLENLESLTFHGYIYRQGIERGTNRPYFIRIPLWEMTGSIM